MSSRLSARDSFANRSAKSEHMALPEKHYTFSISIPVRKFWRVYLPAAAGIAIVAALLAVFFIDVLIMPGIVGIERGAVKVPQVQGLSLEQGREKFFGAGLLTEIKSREYNDQVPEDAIISQNPDPGTPVKKGRRMLVVVSKGAEFASIPDVSGMAEHQARTEMRKHGYAVAEVKRKFSESVPYEKVIETDPQAGAGVSRETKVVLYLSRGSKATSAEMPNIVGETVEDAQKKIESCGLKLGDIAYRSDPSLKSGMVTSQSIPPGETVPIETTVNITASSAQ